MKIYHNTRCKKSRAGLQYLQEKGIEHKVIQYLKDEPFTEKSLKSVIEKTGKTPFEMIRKQEVLYKKEYKGKELSDNDWLKIMTENPRLINRPIIETDNKAVWGDPTEEIEKIL